MSRYEIDYNAKENEKCMQIRQSQISGTWPRFQTEIRKLNGKTNR